MNLLTNANKFQSNNQIKVRCQLKQSSQMLRVSVKDKGIGIKKDDADKIWIPFVRINNGR